MANYVVSDTNLTAVADAIRSKGGTAAGLAFPAGFVSAIADIPTGIGRTLLLSQSITVQTTSTSQSTVTSLALGASAWTSSQILLVTIRGQSGPRAGYFYGTDEYYYNSGPANGTTSSPTPVGMAFRYNADGVLQFGTRGYGVYTSSLDSQGNLLLRSRYSATNSLTVDDTFLINVYLMDLPGGNIALTV